MELLVEDSWVNIWKTIQRSQSDMASVLCLCDNGDFLQPQAIDREVGNLKDTMDGCEILHPLV